MKFSIIDSALWYLDPKHYFCKTK